MIPELSDAEIERFWSKVDRGSDCWVWTKELNSQGYGRFPRYRGSTRQRLLAHRVAYFLATGLDLTGLVVRHRCDNPPCCRPDHLSVGTQFDNMRDAAARGRVNLSGLEKGWVRQSDRLRERLQKGVKRCPDCTIELPIEAFSRNRCNPDGRQTICKGCSAVRQRQRQQWGGLDAEERKALRQRRRSA